MPFAVLRIAKLKTWGDIAGAGKHDLRERDTPNADQSRSGLNKLLIGSEEKGIVDAIKETIGPQRIRKNAVLGVEMLLSASPEYFRPSRPEQAGAFDKGRLDTWSGTTTLWLQQRYGDRIQKAVLHLDEATPHIHVLMVPLDDKGKLNCRALFGGSRHTLSALQTDYAQALAPLGIERGVINSRARHEKVSQYYTLTQAEATPELPAAKTYTPPEMPSKVARMSDSRLVQYAREAATSGAKAQRAALEPVVQALNNENGLLRRDNARLKKANAALEEQKAVLRKQLDAVRGLELGPVLSRLFKAKGPYGEKHSAQQRYILPDRREVMVSENRWRIDNAKRGKGAIDLVMALRGHAQHSLDTVVAELARAFGVEKATGEYVSRTIAESESMVRQAAEKHPALPERERQKEKRYGVSR